VKTDRLTRRHKEAFDWAKGQNLKLIYRRVHRVTQGKTWNPETETWNLNRRLASFRAKRSEDPESINACHRELKYEGSDLGFYKSGKRFNAE
jgi:hypothetical protein